MTVFIAKFKIEENEIRCQFKTRYFLNHAVGNNRKKKPDIGWSDAISDEYPGRRFEDKFPSANQMDGISKAGGDKMVAS